MDCYHYFVLLFKISGGIFAKPNFIAITHACVRGILAVGAAAAKHSGDYNQEKSNDILQKVP
jgi:hypothetical protein